VQVVRFVSKDSALAKARQDLPDVGDMFSDLTVNPLPASLEILLLPDARTEAALESISKAAEAYPFVEDVVFGRDWTEKLFALRRVAGVTVGVLGIAFAVVATLIIGTALKIAIYARRDEIHIMRLVGARDGFIRLPFLLEGAVAGLIGGVLAALLTYATYRVIFSFLFVLSWIPASWVAIGVVAGGVFGVLASGFSLRRHLREV
jgi:cell division transport system permease protein